MTKSHRAPIRFPELVEDGSDQIRAWTMSRERWRGKLQTPVSNLLTRGTTVPPPAGGDLPTNANAITDTNMNTNTSTNTNKTM